MEGSYQIICVPSIVYNPDWPEYKLLYKGDTTWLAISHQTDAMVAPVLPSLICPPLAHLEIPAHANT